MPSRKSTTLTAAHSTRKKQPQGKTRHSIQDRARAIIADGYKHDLDTRTAIRHALDTQAGDLAELVKRAEAGEMICDLTLVDEEQAEAVRAILRLIELPGLPDFLQAAVMTAINHASKTEGVMTWFEVAPGGGGYSATKLADLFAVTVGTRPDLALEPTRDFAALLSAALTHPDCPSDVYNAVGDALPAPERWDTPEAIRYTLGQPGPATPEAPPRVNDLAQKLSDILADENTPAEIRAHLREGLSEVFNGLDNNDAITDRPEYIRALFARAAREGGK